MATHTYKDEGSFYSEGTAHFIGEKRGPRPVCVCVFLCDIQAILSTTFLISWQKCFLIGPGARLRNTALGLWLIGPAHLSRWLATPWSLASVLQINWLSWKRKEQNRILKWRNRLTELKECLNYSYLKNYWSLWLYLWIELLSFHRWVSLFL